jgi:uncharacterized protein (TIGR01244 family)
MFRQISDHLWASPQITLDDVKAAKDQGFALIINNRPEGESDDQTSGDDVAAAAQAAGLGYVAIPITHAGFSQAQVSAMVDALNAGEGKILAYCRSGTRSTLLWALAQASLGADLDSVSAQAANGGYDVSGIRPLMDMLAAQAR